MSHRGRNHAGACDVFGTGGQVGEVVVPGGGFFFHLWAGEELMACTLWYVCMSLLHLGILRMDERVVGLMR